MVGESCYELGSPVVLGKRCRACSALEPKEIGQQYERLFTIGKELLAEWDMDRLLSEAIDRLIEISSAQRGMIILFDEGGEIFFEKARNLKKEDIEQPEFEINYSIIHRVRAEGAQVCIRNVIKGLKRQRHRWAGRLSPISVICLPISHQRGIFGVVYLDNLSVPGLFAPEMCTFVKAFSDFISVAAHHVLERKRLDSRPHTVEAELRGRHKFESIVGDHPRMLEILDLVSRIADTDATVLIQGESGTGKELIALALHHDSRRNDKPFVPINCGALPENLLESELFGHDRGAFTGAIKDKPGWFEHADGGTVFLDEVSEMTPALQTRLLRVLQTGEYSPVGSTIIQRCDVRVVAATNKDLRELVKEGNFREEVFYRLNVIEIVLPPLRDRKSDILPLAHHFLKIYGRQYGKEGLSLSREAEAWLLAYNFPGNVRELEHAIHRSVVLAERESVEPHHFSNSVCRDGASFTQEMKPAAFKVAKKLVVEKFEREYLIDCLKATKGNITRAARTAGINVKNFHTKMKYYGINHHCFK